MPLHNPMLNGPHYQRWHMLSLPAEVIHIILTYVISHNGIPRIPYKWVRSVRSTCVVFRRLADQLPFWYDDDFDFHGLLFPGPCESQAETLLADEHLMACLVRKRVWRVSSPLMFDIIGRKIPGFRDNTRSLALERFVRTESWHEVITSLESSFGQLTS